jgi:hypothetical protein
VRQWLDTKSTTLFMLMFAMLMVLGWWVLQVNLNVMRVVSVQ